MIVFMVMLIGSLGFLGIVLGSFVNALVWRIHEQEQLIYTGSNNRRKTLSPQSRLRLAELSIIRGRSMCVDCGHTLAAKDLLPLISWLSVGGKCRYCRKSISWQYPVVELITGLLFAVSALSWPYAMDGLAWIGLFAIWLAMVVLFVALAVYDLRWMILPNRLVFVLQAFSAVFAVAFILLTGSPSASTWLSPFWGVVTIAGLFWSLYTISRHKWIGGGDVKLAVAIGLIVGGPIRATLVIFVASLLGSLVGIPVMILSKQCRQVRIPFGPFLIIATILVFWFGASIVEWYSKQIGLH